MASEEARKLHYKLIYEGRATMHRDAALEWIDAALTAAKAQGAEEKRVECAEALEIWARNASPQLKELLNGMLRDVVFATPPPSPSPLAVKIAALAHEVIVEGKPLSEEDERSYLASKIDALLRKQRVPAVAAYNSSGGPMPPPEAARATCPPITEAHLTADEDIPYRQPAPPAPDWLGEQQIKAGPPWAEPAARKLAQRLLDLRLISDATTVAEALKYLLPVSAPKPTPPSPDWVEAAAQECADRYDTQATMPNFKGIIRSHAPKLPSAAELAEAVRKALPKHDVWLVPGGPVEADLAAALQRVLDGGK